MSDYLKLIGQLQFIRDYECKTMAEVKTINDVITILSKSAEPEVIRCKDCKYWTHIKRTNRYWCKTDDGLFDLNPSPDDFCSRAERRGEQE